MARGRVYNQIFTPDLWDQVNPINKEIMDDFLAEYRQRKKAASTIKAYSDDLKLILILILQTAGPKD